MLGGSGIDLGSDLVHFEFDVFVGKDGSGPQKFSFAVTPVPRVIHDAMP